MNLLDPFGLVALLSLPALVAIHCLRRRSQVLRTPTLFLVDRAREPDEGGRKFRRFRGSVPFWLQALALVLLSLLLAGLHFGHLKKVARVAVVMDSTASVMPFREEVVDGVMEKLKALSQGIKTTEFTVLDSYPGARPIYHGTTLSELSAALQDWRPGRHGHDPAENLRIARSLAGESGIVVFATDREPSSMTEGFAVFAAGKPLSNVGFLGVDVRPGEDGFPRWRAVVRNYSDIEVETSWGIEVDGSVVGNPRSLTLPPDGVVTVAGGFPETVDELVLVLEPDAFDFDNRLPLVRPIIKEILLASKVSRESRFAPLLAKLVTSLRGVRQVAVGAPDCEVILYDPESPPASPAQSSAIVFLASQRPGKLHTGDLVVANHPLVKDLVWESVLVPDGPALALAETDEVLVWAGEKPLVALRPTGDGQLLFNFDVARSNVRKLPAFVLLCHRFIEQLRQAKVAIEAVNIGITQRMGVTGNLGAESTRLVLVPRGADPQPFLGVSPDKPGFFEIFQGDARLVTAAAHFEDPEEADLREAGAADTVPTTNPTALEEARRGASWWRALLLLLALVAALGAWHFQGRATVSPPLFSSTR